MKRGGGLEWCEMGMRKYGNMNILWNCNHTLPSVIHYLLLIIYSVSCRVQGSVLFLKAPHTIDSQSMYFIFCSLWKVWNAICKQWFKISSLLFFFSINTYAFGIVIFFLKCRWITVRVVIVEVIKYIEIIFKNVVFKHNQWSQKSSIGVLYY